MKLDDVYDLIDRLIRDKYGNQATFSRCSGLSSAYVSDVVNRRKEPGPAMLKAIGVEKVVSYREVK